ncbi:hypothetical protein AA100600_1516 [Gluconobacter thailandicus F149-1 = NBRC 100600]|nr:hypothetical protein AA100600_1516 [Gluconobacter thailandicus F149-1 = NBRC 100600]
MHLYPRLNETRSVISGDIARCYFEKRGFARAVPPNKANPFSWQDAKLCSIKERASAKSVSNVL